MTPKQRLSAALIVCALAATSHAQQIVVSKDNRTIAVTTSADASADADTVTVQIGYLVYGADQDSAYALGSKTSNALLRLWPPPKSRKKPFKANRKASRPCSNMAIRSGHPPRKPAASSR